MTITLTAQERKAGVGLDELRASGSVPAVVYGAGRETTSISVQSREFQNVFKEAGESGIITLEMPSGKASVLVHDMTSDPVRGTPEHIDFLAIDISKPIQVKIPLEFTGVSPAIKGGLGVLVKVIHEIEVKGLPSAIPHTLIVDISGLDVLDSNIKVSELALPAGVEAIAKDSDIVVSISAFKEEKEDAPTVIDFASIEVEKKGKKEEEGEAGAEKK
ncbi:MAG: 50S ribosomal protein L25 [Candidatus Pacebacteria bacterium]|nr:50S ribosomal protein L25 [Candidatus Paceibacterota bacterium]